MFGVFSFTILDPNHMQLLSQKIRFLLFFPYITEVYRSSSSRCRINQEVKSPEENKWPWSGVMMYKTLEVLPT